MKKYILILALLIPLFSSAQTVPFSVDLHYGSKGDDVVALQEFLADQGVFTGAATGNFYSITLASVRKFQKAEGITPVSGYVGPITRGVINDILSKSALDSEGDATTTKPTIDLSQAQIAPVSAPIQVYQSPAPQAVAPTPVATSTPVIDCTPTLSPAINKIDGDITTGTDFMFVGVYTLPVNCQIDPTAEIGLQTPTIKYRATISGDSIKLTPHGFIYTQGWGTGVGVVPAGSFIWTVGAFSTSTSIQ